MKLSTRLLRGRSLLPRSRRIQSFGQMDAIDRVPPKLVLPSAIHQ